MKVFIVDTPAWSKSTSPEIAPNRCGSRSLVESVECLLVRNALAAAQVRAASKRGTLVDGAGLVLRVLRSGAKSWSQRTIIAENVAMSGSLPSSNPRRRQGRIYGSRSAVQLSTSPSPASSTAPGMTRSRQGVRRSTAKAGLSGPSHPGMIAGS